MQVYDALQSQIVFTMVRTPRRAYTPGLNLFYSFEDFSANHQRIVRFINTSYMKHSSNTKALDCKPQRTQNDLMQIKELLATCPGIAEGLSKKAAMLCAKTQCTKG